MVGAGSRKRGVQVDSVEARQVRCVKIIKKEVKNVENKLSEPL